MKLLAIGEAMAELRRDEAGGWQVGFAGDTFNTAVYAARLIGTAGAVGFLSRAGTDPLSNDFRLFATKEGLDPALIATDKSHPIGIYSVATDPQGERSFNYWRSTSAARLMFSDVFDGQAIPTSEVIYLSGISIAILTPDAREALFVELLRRKTEGSAKIAFDSNYRPHLWEDPATAQASISRFWQLADVALPSIDDEQALFGGDENDVAERFLAGGHGRVAMKRGSRGPFDPQLNAAHPSFPPAVRVVDTTAAGDSFNAGYLAAFIAGQSSADCMLAGHALASQVVGARGAIMACN